MPAKIRIKATCPRGFVQYIHQNARGGWGCTGENGTSLSFFYAGIDQETACRFALEDAETPEQALAAVKLYGSRRYTYELHRPEYAARSEADQLLADLIEWDATMGFHEGVDLGHGSRLHGAGP